MSFNKPVDGNNPNQAVTPDPVGSRNTAQGASNAGRANGRQYNSDATSIGVTRTVANRTNQHNTQPAPSPLIFSSHELYNPGSGTLRNLARGAETIYNTSRSARKDKHEALKGEKGRKINETREERSARHAAIREKKARETPEERSARHAARARDKRAKESPEETKKRLALLKEKRAVERAERRKIDPAYDAMCIAKESAINEYYEYYKNESGYANSQAKVSWAQDVKYKIAVEGKKISEGPIAVDRTDAIVPPQELLAIVKRSLAVPIDDAFQKPASDSTTDL